MALTPERAMLPSTTSTFKDGTSGINRPTGNTGKDWVSGGAAEDAINVNRGHDTLTGAVGNDILQGGPGIERMAGGRNGEILAPWGNEGQDMISDCARGVDRIKLLGISSSRVSWQPTPQDGGAAMLTEFGSGATMTLDHVAAPGQSDFILA
ncbi:hypothetical protein ACFOD4_00930 [Pseudoroseomonas globiformis]|uniref:Calcium-binding protein n=1 Tax=Teichococcus globiformis TaxID=2307229 RepID=A0ABV7FWI5_9PROT